MVRSGKGKRPEDYVVPPKEELEALRYIPPKEERVSDWQEPKSELAEKLEDIFSADEKRSAKPRRPQGSRQGKGHGGGHNNHGGPSRFKRRKNPPREG